MTDTNGIKTNIAWIRESLERIEKRLDKDDEKHSVIDRELGALSVKASIIGAIAGVVGGGTIAFVQLIYEAVK